MNNKTQKWLIGLVIALAIINVSLMIFVWRGHIKLRDQMPPMQGRMERPELTGRAIIRDLDMNKEQRDLMLVSAAWVYVLGYMFELYMRYFG